MRLTPEEIRRAKPYLNPLNQREIGFRHLNITLIENIAVLDDIFDCMDFTGNQLLKLDNFPLRERLDMLLLSGNRISVIDENVGKHLPKLTTLNLANNKIATFTELAKLRTFPNLTTLILDGNPLVQQYENWKLITLVFLPRLTQIDYGVVTDEQREQADKLKKKLKKGAVLESILVKRTAPLRQPHRGGDKGMSDEVDYLEVKQTGGNNNNKDNNNKDNNNNENNNHRNNNNNNNQNKNNNNNNNNHDRKPRGGNSMGDN